MKKVWKLYEKDTENKEEVKLYFVMKNGQTIVYFLPSDRLYEMIKMDMEQWKDRGNRGQSFDLHIRCINGEGREQFVGSVPESELCLNKTSNMRVYLSNPLDIETEAYADANFKELSLQYGDKSYESSGFWREESVDWTKAESYVEEGDKERADKKERSIRDKNGLTERDVQWAKEKESENSVRITYEIKEEREKEEENKQKEEEVIEIPEELKSERIEEAEDSQIERRKLTDLCALDDEMAFRVYKSNSFLLHGYYNYEHVIIEKNGDRERLGVPGNYHKRELYMAQMFGFPVFEAKNPGVATKNGTYGYYFTKE